MSSLKSQKKGGGDLRRGGMNELKARFLRGANTSGEPFWVSFNPLSDGWANREAVSSG